MTCHCPASFVRLHVPVTLLAYRGDGTTKISFDSTTMTQQVPVSIETRCRVGVDKDFY